MDTSNDMSITKFFTKAASEMYEEDTDELEVTVSVGTAFNTEVDLCFRLILKSIDGVEIGDDV